MAAAAALLLLLAGPAVARAQLQPNNFITSGDACRSQGAAGGPAAARRACNAAIDRCRGGGLVGAGRSSGIGAVSLPQCANIGLGACQSAADPWRSPCAYQMRSGYGTCSGQTFQSYYTAAATSFCTAHAQTISGVTPGTNQWAPTPYGPTVPAVISPGSVVGGAIGSSIGSAIGGSGSIIGAIGGAIGAGIGNTVDRAAINAIGGRRLLSPRGAPAAAGA
jgi:hypothetical protein